MLIRHAFLIILILFSVNSNGGNETIQSFNKAEKLLEKRVYNQLPKITIYCLAKFDKNNIIDANGFRSGKYKKRAGRVEWEHIVPAENFGRTFSEWRTGHPECVTRKGKAFKGRNCASKINNEYRYMQADMYNLYPAIGAVNALRSNYRYSMLIGDSLGDCAMVINSKERKAMPPTNARGIVARVNLYFEQAYPRYRLSKAQKKLFSVWDRQFPVTKTECKRNKFIEAIQGNTNEIMKSRCKF